MLNALRFAGVCAVLAAGLITSASARGAVDGAVDLDLKGHVGQGPGDELDFAVEAPAVEGLYPGAEEPMKLTISNPFAFDVKVISLSGRVRSTSNPSCAPVDANLRVGPHTGPPSLPLVVPGRDRRPAGSVVLYMPSTVANACQGTSFVVQFDGSATKVNK
jgi:hypothetical protein